MNFLEYQNNAVKTDRVPGLVEQDGLDVVIVPMLGLAGEAGQLLSECKKHLRDGDAHTLFKDRVAEELGDLLWYISNVATKYGLSLQDVAIENLTKTNARWLESKKTKRFFDEEFPIGEQLPRKAVVEIQSLNDEEVRILIDGQKIGADLKDNNNYPDGYRFHDVFHFSYAAILGWSPVTRSIMEVKRKSNKKVDEVQDGGRATVIEEGISALVFQYAENHNWLEGVSRLDFSLLRTIQDLTAYLEVGEKTPAEWEDAILQGFAVWRSILSNNGGKFEIDMYERKLTFLG